MKTICKILMITLLVSVLNSCGNEGDIQQLDQAENRNVVLTAAAAPAHPAEETHHEAVHISLDQYDALDMLVDTIQQRALQGFVETNGQLTLPPQSQAAVTAVIGANIGSVEVIEGQDVKKGQVLAYIYHPGLVQLQTDLIAHASELGYLEQEFHRQQQLFEGKVGAGKDFQKVKADYLSAQATVKGLEAQLKMLGVAPSVVKAGKILERIAVRAPIGGHVQSVNVRTGQYVAPQQVLFELIHTGHIHAHFKVFERDILKVKEGQKVRFTVEAQPDVEHEAVIFNIGKSFDPVAKSVGLHAEVENQQGHLLPGMYAHGRIVITDEKSKVLPREAVVMEGDRHFAFHAEKIREAGEEEWHFTPVEISIGREDEGWVEIKLHQRNHAQFAFAQNNAYYLLAEMNKEEAGHEH